MRALLLALLVACSAPPPAPSAERGAESSAEPPVRADINAAYLDPSLDVASLDRGFSAESREVFAARDAITAALGIQPGDAVADVGAGTGIYVQPFSEAVGPEGTVYAVDIAQSLLDYVDALAAERGLANVETVLGGQDTTTLPPASLDLVFTSDVYHHFERPRAMNAHLFEALRPGGTYAVLDFRRGPGAPDWIKRHVRSDMATVIEEVTAAGFAFEGEVPVAGLRENYLVLFRKPTLTD
jgi:predicted methyltransferase